MFWRRFRDLSKGSECIRGSKNVVILTKHFANWSKDLGTLGMLDPKYGHLKEARKCFFRCYSVCETMKDTKEE